MIYDYKINMFANEKGSYSKTLEVSRENSNRSNTTLSTDFLLKAENYVVNVTNFVTSTTPVLNLIKGPFFTVRPVGDNNEDQDDAEQKDQAREFEPTPYRTWLELARQCEKFFNGITDTWNVGRPFPNIDMFHSVSYLKSSGCLRLRLSHQFLSQYYIEVNPKIQKILRLPRFLYTVRHALNNDYISSNTHTDDEFYLEDAPPGGIAGFQGDFRTNGVAAIPSMYVNSEIPLSELDQRESIDVYSTFPMRSKIIAMDGEEEHEHILFRLPYAEQHTFKSISTYVNNEYVRNKAEVIEDMEIGLVDLCARHAETLHQVLLPGRIRAVFLRIAVRYKTLDGIKEEEFDFSNGFWYIRLLFVKKV
jgi:hypothetical protein